MSRVSATKGVLIECDESVREILLKLNQSMHFIIEELDSQHLFIDGGQLDRINIELNRQLSTNVYLSPDSVNIKPYPSKMGKGWGSRRNNFQDELVPELTSEQRIGKVMEIRGNNLIGVIIPESDQILHLALLPPRYRGVFFVRRGSFVILSPWAQPESGQRVAWCIDFILQTQHVKEMRREGRWPSCFEKIVKEESSEAEEEEEHVSSE